TGFLQANLEVNALRNHVGLDFNGRVYNNYIFFDSYANPVQANIQLMTSRVGLFGKVNLKKIYLKAKVNYQLTNSEFVFRLPNYVAQAQLYYEDKIFKKNLHWQVGAQATYYSDFKANAYMPATNMYYIQDTKTVGNYPFLDFFINCDIKPVRFFFKLEHINQGLTGSNFMLTPNYPMPDRAFKFGFTWLFWD
ncbi:MAG: hypothetical protein IAF38_10715, partial [Bacteroidia bacterium]|nr:hypothetical protein [Bacteroidia bacterium]